MIPVDRIIKEHSFESERLNSMILGRRIALLCSVLQGLLSLTLISMFTSMFISIFRLFLDEVNGFIYGIMGFMASILIFILYSAFGDNFALHIKRIFPNLSLSKVTKHVIAIFGVFTVIFLAWNISISVFGGIDIEKNGSEFIWTWVKMMGVMIALMLPTYLVGIPIKRFKKTYFDNISRWLINKIDANSVFHENHRWPEKFSLRASANLDEIEGHDGIDMKDALQIFAGYITELNSCSFEDSFTLFPESQDIQHAYLEVKIKKENRTQGKVSVDIIDIFKGSILKKKTACADVIFRVSSKVGQPIIIGQKVNPEASQIGNQTFETAGNQNYERKSQLTKLTVNLQRLWSSDITSLVYQGSFYLLIHDTHILKDLALSADLFSDEHIMLPLQTIHDFEEFEA